MQKVRAGQSVSIEAATWNAFIDAANWARQSRLNSATKGLSAGLDVGIVRVKNTTERTYPRFSALVLSGVCITPDTNEDEFVSCPPVFQGVAMTASLEGEPFAILVEPAEAGAIARAMILGLTPAQVTINDSDDAYAVPTPGSETGALESASSGVARILWKGSGAGAQWCLLQLGGAGSGASEEKAAMCKVTGGSATAGYQVAVYPNGRTDEGSTYSALLFLPDLALDADLPSGTWILGHKCAIASTGGNET